LPKARNGDCIRPKRRQFVTLSATVVDVIVAENGVKVASVDEA